jgi:hypothetical protein
MDVTVDVDRFDTGAGLDPTVPTTLDDGRVVPAGVALVQAGPSRAMCQFAHAVASWVRELGGTDVDVVGDHRASSSRPGGLMVRWGGDVKVMDVAAMFGSIPCWCQLRADVDSTTRFWARY